MLALLTVGLLILVHHTFPIAPWWQLTEIGVILIIYGLVEVWTHANTPAFLRNVSSNSKVERNLSYFSTDEEIDEVLSPASDLKLITSNQLDGTADPQIYLHKGFLYSQN